MQEEVGEIGVGEKDVHFAVHAEEKNDVHVAVYEVVELALLRAFLDLPEAPEAPDGALADCRCSRPWPLTGPRTPPQEAGK